MEYFQELGDGNFLDKWLHEKKPASWASGDSIRMPAQPVMGAHVQGNVTHPLGVVATDIS